MKPIVFLSHPPEKLEQYYGPRAVTALQAVAEVRFNPEARELTMAELAVAAAGCDMLIGYRQTPGPERLFRELPQLLVFLRCAVDISTVDLAAASAHGVLVTQASAGFVPAVAEWIVAAMIDLGRGIGRYAAAYRQSGTPPPSVIGRELRGSTLGIVGYGRIARHLATLARAFGMRILVTTPEAIDANEGIEAVPLATLLAQSHFVTCLAVSNPQTHGLFDAAAFAAMARGAYFINASRGELVDEAALLGALDSGRLGGCALDVGRAPDQMPSPALARHPLVVATPHIGGLTLPAIEHQSMETAAQVTALVRGEMPTGAVNAAHASRLRAWRETRPGRGR